MQHIGAQTIALTLQIAGADHFGLAALAKEAKGQHGPGRGEADILRVKAQDIGVDLDNPRIAVGLGAGEGETQRGFAVTEELHIARRQNQRVAAVLVPRLRRAGAMGRGGRDAHIGNPPLHGAELVVREILRQ